MRLIDADEAREKMLKLLDHHLMMCNYSADSATQDCIEVVNEATVVDAEPVVRCKDCKHEDDDVMCPIYHWWVEDKNSLFCAFGERRTDNET